MRLEEKLRITDDTHTSTTYRYTICKTCSCSLLKQEVKFEVKGHRGHEEGGKAVGGGVIEERETGSCLVSQPGVAGEREVGEKVEETRGVQEDNRMMGVEGRERWLERERKREKRRGRE